MDCALAGAEAIALVSKRSSGRLSSYRNNMAIRRNIASVRDLRLKGRPALSTTTSGTLKGTVSVIGGAEGCGLDLFLSLPHDSWGVIAPNSTRERIGHYIGRSELSIGQTLTVELELSLPQGSKGGTVTLFVKPSKDVLEEEA